jgi:hypothetical protein
MRILVVPSICLGGFISSNDPNIILGKYKYTPPAGEITILFHEGVNEPGPLNRPVVPNQGWVNKQLSNKPFSSIVVGLRLVSDGVLHDSWIW